MAKSDATTIEVAGREVRVSSPAKVLFPQGGWTKLDLVEYYLTCSEAVLLGVRERPTVQKRVQAPPEWLQTATVTFPSGRSATELVPVDAAHLVWATNLNNIDWNPWPVRRADLDSPDELRVDLDPSEGVGFETVREVAMTVRDVLDEHGMRGFPKTSGSRGIHIYVRLEPRWDFTQVRRAALALAREVERRMPGRATSKWWKEERVGGFLDYNQNARDRTVASAYSVRPVADARVSCGLRWEEVPDCELADFRIDTVPARLAEIGDPLAEIDDVAHDLTPLLDLAQRDEEQGLGDAPWPPHFRKQRGEPKRVQPSRKKKSSKKES
jgi:bifunctional non-homologous end joining protein LigD